MCVFNSHHHDAAEMAARPIGALGLGNLVGGGGEPRWLRRQSRRFRRHAVTPPKDTQYATRVSSSSNSKQASSKYLAAASSQHLLKCTAYDSFHDNTTHAEGIHHEVGTVRTHSQPASGNASATESLPFASYTQEVCRHARAHQEYKYVLANIGMRVVYMASGEAASRVARGVS
jgi:hypothetical protein